jgi:hypothetical protein
LGVAQRSNRIVDVEECYATKAHSSNAATAHKKITTLNFAFLIDQQLFENFSN